MKYLHHLFLGVALFSGCNYLEEPEDTAEATDPKTTENLFVDPYEPNNDANNATPMNLVDPIQARLQIEDDVDFYVFTAPDSFDQGGFVLTYLAPFPGRPAFEFYNDQKQYYAGRAHSNTLGADLSAWMSVVPGATYYARVADYSDRASDKPYTLRLEYVPVNDPHEPNNDFDEAAAIALDSSYTALMYHHGSRSEEDFRDHYKVSLAGPGRIQVAITQFPREFSPEFTIYDTNGKSIKRAHSNTRGSDLIESSDAVEAGEYIIRVTYYGGSPDLGGPGTELPQYATQPYRFKVSVLP